MRCYRCNALTDFYTEWPRAPLCVRCHSAAMAECPGMFALTGREYARRRDEIAELRSKFKESHAQKAQD